MFSRNGGRSAAEAMGSKASHLAHAKKLRDRAEECRVISGLVKDEKIATQYIGLADSYERMALIEEALANEVQLVDLPPHIANLGVPWEN